MLRPISTAYAIPPFYVFFSLGLNYLLFIVIILGNAFQVKIEKLVTAMGGAFQTRATLDINFVIVHNVLSAKYKVHEYFETSSDIKLISTFISTHART